MSENLEQVVKSRYGAVAMSHLSTEHEGVRAVAEAFGYTPAELSSIPAEANMGFEIVSFNVVFARLITSEKRLE